MVFIEFIGFNKEDVPIRLPTSRVLYFKETTGGQVSEQPLNLISMFDWSWSLYSAMTMENFL